MVVRPIAWSDDLPKDRIKGKRLTLWRRIKMCPLQILLLLCPRRGKGLITGHTNRTGRLQNQRTNTYQKLLPYTPPHTLSILPLAKFILYPYSPSFLLTNSPFYFFLTPLHPSHPRSPYPRPCHPPAMRTCHNPKHLPDRLIVVIHNTCRDQPPRPSHPSASHPPFPNTSVSYTRCRACVDLFPSAGERPR